MNEQNEKQVELTSNFASLRVAASWEVRATPLISMTKPISIFSGVDGSSSAVVTTDILQRRSIQFNLFYHLMKKKTYKSPIFSLVTRFSRVDSDVTIIIIIQETISILISNPNENNVIYYIIVLMWLTICCSNPKFIFCGSKHGGIRVGNVESNCIVSLGTRVLSTVGWLRTCHFLDGRWDQRMIDWCHVMNGRVCGKPWQTRRTFAKLG